MYIYRCAKILCSISLVSNTYVRWKESKFSYVGCGNNNNTCRIKPALTKGFELRADCYSFQSTLVISILLFFKSCYRL